MQKIRQENYFKTPFDFFKQNVIQGINKSAAWFQCTLIAVNLEYNKKVYNVLSKGF